MFEYMTIIISVISVLTSVINLIISKKNGEQIDFDILDKKSLSIKNYNKISNSSDLKHHLQTLYDCIEKLYPSSNAEISIHILKKDTQKLEDSIVEHWVSLPSSTKHKYTVKNNTDFNSLLVDENKYFFVSDLNEYELKREYINENPNYNKWQTTIAFPIRNSKIGDSEIIGFLCVVSPEKFNDVRKNKKIISLFSKTSGLLSEAIINKLKTAK